MSQAVHAGFSEPGVEFVSVTVCAYSVSDVSRLWRRPAHWLSSAQGVAYDSLACSARISPPLPFGRLPGFPALGVGHGFSRFSTCRPSSAFSGTFSIEPVSLWSRLVGMPHFCGVDCPRATRVRLWNWPESRVTLLASSAVAVGHIPRAFAALRELLPPSSPVVRAVGQYPQPLPSMRGTDIVRSQHAPLRIEPDFGKVTKDAAKHASSIGISASEETGYILEEPEGSVTLSQYAKGVRPEVSGVQAAEAFPGLTVRLARKASGDDVARAGDGVEVPHVAVERHVGESGGEDALAVGIMLDKLHWFPSEDEAAEQSATGSGEEGEFAHVTGTPYTRPMGANHYHRSFEPISLRPTRLLALCTARRTRCWSHKRRR